MKNKILLIIGYILCILLDVFTAMVNYPLFMQTYGEASFSKGTAGIFVFWLPYIIVLIVCTVVFILFMKHLQKKNK